MGLRALRGLGDGSSPSPTTHACSARRHAQVRIDDPPAGAHQRMGAERMVAAGKPPKVILLTIARRLPVFAHAIVRTQKPFAFVTAQLADNPSGSEQAGSGWWTARPAVGDLRDLICQEGRSNEKHLAAANTFAFIMFGVARRHDVIKAASTAATLRPPSFCRQPRRGRRCPRDERTRRTRGRPSCVDSARQADERRYRVRRCGSGCLRWR